MVLMSVRNGLGNQMFIYAFGEILKDKCDGLEVRYDASELPMVINGRYTYDVNDIFTSTFKAADDKSIRKITGKKFYCSFSGIKNKFIDRLRILSGALPYKEGKAVLIREPLYWNIPENFIDSMIDMKPDNNRDYYFVGVWENSKYILNYREKLQDLFSFKTDLKNNPYYKYVTRENSVAVHVRRGDYFSTSDNKTYPYDDYNIATLNYYDKAIETIKYSIENPIFIFFSDDAEFVRNHFSEIKNKIIVEGNKDYEDMQLMSLCKNLIVANSTFSFWAAFLNRRGGSVVAPKRFYTHFENDQEKRTVEFFKVPNWTYIDENGCL